MNKNSLGSQSAKRVNSLLTSKEKPILKKKTGKVTRTHTYNREEPYPIPRGIDHLKIQRAKEGKSLGKAKIIPQKAPPSSFHSQHCSAKSNTLLFFIEKAYEFQNKKVRTCKLKEQLIARRNLEKLSLEMRHWMHTQIQHKIQPFADVEEQEIYPFIERGEERLFQIDRIIRYLSD